MSQVGEVGMRAVSQGVTVALSNSRPYDDAAKKAVVALISACASAWVKLPVLSVNWVRITRTLEVAALAVLASRAAKRNAAILTRSAVMRCCRFRITVLCGRSGA